MYATRTQPNVLSIIVNCWRYKGRPPEACIYSNDNHRPAEVVCDLIGSRL